MGPVIGGLQQDQIEGQQEVLVVVRPVVEVQHDVVGVLPVFHVVQLESVLGLLQLAGELVFLGG